MKKQVSNSQAGRLITPGALSEVTAGYKDKATITPCAWHLPVSKNPPLLGVALAKGHFSSELIKQSKEFVVNVPQWELLNKVFICGKCSGREEDKFVKANLSKAAAKQLKETPVISECLGHIECKLSRTEEIGDHYLFVGEAIYAEADCFSEGFWDSSKVDLIFHLGAKNFFKSSPYIEL